MKRRRACLSIVALPLLAAFPARAQARPLRIAWVSTDRAGASPFLEAFRAGMRELGYAEGRNLAIDAWWGDGSTERLQKLAPEIVAAQPDIVLTQGGAFGAMRRAGVQKPTVFVMSANPVVAKYVESYARPGGNATGISLFDLEPFGKRMEYLREAMPAVKRIAVLANPQHPGEQMELQVARSSAERVGMELDYYPVNADAELERALTRIAESRVGAIVAFSDAFIVSHAGRIAAFSLQQRIPAVSGWAVFAQRGNLMSYGPVISECYRRVASHVQRIHRGAKPGELPVEQPVKLELVINLTTAKAIGLTLPQSLLVRADRVIQ